MILLTFGVQVGFRIRALRVRGLIEVRIESFRSKPV